MTIQVKPSGSALGAEISGADLTRPPDDATFAQIRAAFYRHEVIFFRGPALSDEDQIRFTARFGELRKLKLASQAQVVNPEIFVVSNIVKDGKPEFTYRHNWQQHDLVMWDDCSTQHKATFDYPASLPRLMHRTTVVGGTELH